MHGEYPAEKIVLKKSPEKCRIVFSVTPVGPTRESTVGIFELEETIVEICSKMNHNAI